MGFFRANYDRPGPGVSKDEPRKKGVARFFELLFRDMGDLAKLNVLFFVTLIPTSVWFLFGIIGFYTPISLIISLLLAYPVGGAAAACIYYITKMMRDEPSYVWFEFKRKFRENHKQAAPVGIFCMAFIYAQILIWSSLWRSLIEGESIGGFFWYFLAFLSIVFFLMIIPYVFMHFSYIELKTRLILKNSVLMAFGYFPRTIMGALFGGMLWLIYALFVPAPVIASPILVLLTMLILMLVCFTLCALLCLMWVWKPFDGQFKVEETLKTRSNETTEEE